VEEAVEGLKKLSITGKRLNIRHGNGFTVIDDSYNAAPESMKSAIGTLMSAEGGRKIAMLAGMNELGEQSESYHEEVGRFAAESSVTLVAGVGEKAAAIVKGAKEAGGNAVWFGSNEELFDALPELLEKGDTILVKGSNAMRMELAADKIVGENEVK
jgi:UDP-N-acetylmuramoyl-tripeptide--D-alanyl-D-alanine ligase